MGTPDWFGGFGPPQRRVVLPQIVQILNTAVVDNRPHSSASFIGPIHRPASSALDCADGAFSTSCARSGVLAGEGRQQPLWPSAIVSAADLRTPPSQIKLLPSPTPTRLAGDKRRERDKQDGCLVAWRCLTAKMPLANGAKDRLLETVRHRVSEPIQVALIADHPRLDYAGQWHGVLDALIEYCVPRGQVCQHRVQRHLHDCCLLPAHPVTYRYAGYRAILPTT